MVFTSTTSPLKRRKRFSRCCPGIRHLVSHPGHKKVPVLVRILQRHETSAPTFINRRQNVSAVSDQLIVKLIDIFNTDEEMDAASSPQHGLEMLREGDSQFTRANLGHWRLRVVVD